MSPQHQLTIICSDHGEPSLSSEMLLYVNVTNINDHRPQFTQDTYTAFVMENSKPFEVNVILYSQMKCYYFQFSFRFRRCSLSPLVLSS